MVLFDTLGYAKKLEAVGVPRPQAEAQVEIMSTFVTDNFATKQDLEVFRHEMRSQFREMRGEIAAKFEATEAKISRDLTYRMGGMFIVATGIQISVMSLIMSFMLRH